MEIRSIEMKEQEPFVMRMIDERQELGERLVKAIDFIGSAKFNELDDYQKSLLVRQRDAMAVYFETLTVRLSLNVK